MLGTLLDDTFLPSQYNARIISLFDVNNIISFISVIIQVDIIHFGSLSLYYFKTCLHLT